MQVYWQKIKYDALQEAASSVKTVSIVFVFGLNTQHKSSLIFTSHKYYINISTYILIYIINAYKDNTMYILKLKILYRYFTTKSHTMNP